MQECTFRLVADLNDLSRLHEKIDIEEIGSGDLEFQLSARIINPHGYKLSGVLDVESPNPGSENKAIRFEMAPGEWQPMGTWRLSSGQDELIINADLEPSMPNGVVTFEFHAKPI